MSSRHNQRRHERSTAHQGRIAARPSAHPGLEEPAGIGLRRVKIVHGLEALVYVPATYIARQPSPFALMLHGAGGNADHGIRLLQTQADRDGIILAAVSSRKRTWDMIVNGYGPDIDCIEHTLELVFDRYAVDASRVAVGGFSDGASYALSVGVMNGDLFSHVIAFSPGYMAPLAMRGSPRFYISHGERDATLPIDRCSRRLVPNLREAGYDVDYREFDGPHTVPEAIADEAAAWFVSGEPLAV